MADAPADIQNSVITANNPLMESTPKYIAGILKNALLRFPGVEDSVQGYSEFNTQDYADRSPHNVKAFLTLEFWRKFDPVLRTALDSIISSNKIDRTKLIEWLLLKYLDIASLEPKNLSSSTQPNAYFAKPNPNSEDYQLHLLYLQPFRLFGITAANRKFKGNGNQSAFQWLWHPNAGADSAPVLRKIIQLYLLSQVIDHINDPQYHEAKVLKADLAKLKFEHHLLLQELMIEIEALFKAMSKPLPLVKKLSHHMDFVFNFVNTFSVFIKKASVVFLASYPIFLLLNSATSGLAGLILYNNADTLSCLALISPNLIHAAYNFIVSLIPVSVNSLVTDAFKPVLQKIDGKFGTAFSQPVEDEIIIPENLVKPNLEAPLAILPQISNEQREEASKISMQLGRLNQSYNLTPEVKKQIRDCLTKLDPDAVISSLALNETIEKAKALLQNNFDENEASIMQQLIAHLQTMGVPVSNSENIAIRLRNQQGYQPSLTLLKTLHEKDIIKADGSWNAPNLNVPDSVQEKCRRIEAAMR